MVAKKTDSDQIREFISDLKNQNWIKRTERIWWPSFVFHYTDILNAVDILKEGYLYSRQYMEGAGRIWVNGASSEIITATDEEAKNYVRLYFRPRTPTQYNQEGVKSQETLEQSRYPDAHIPVPIFFLFDSATILTRADCKFSDGNLGSQNANIFSTADELRALPWKQIYHDSSLFNLQNKNEIIHRRNAEVVIPRRLYLNSLRYIYCRSDAEKETLMHLLPSQIRKQYQGKIFSTTRRMPFFRDHTFIESVYLTNKYATFEFSPDTRSPGPFEIIVKIHDTIRDRTDHWKKNRMATGKITLKLPYPMSAYTIYLSLDDHLTFAKTHEDRDIPY